MSFIRKIKKGKHVYLAEVEGKRINGKVVQKHIRYIGRELNGKVIKSGSIENTEVTKVTTWAPLLVLDTLAKQIHLSETLGDYGDYLLSLAYAHCLDPKSVNKMEDWFSRTDLHNMLNIKEVSEKKLYFAMDSINEKNSDSIQKKIFNSVKLKHDLKPKGYFFDVTNAYFYGTECCIAKKGCNKDGKNKPQVQIGLAVTEDEGIPIFHKTFEGNIHDSKILGDMVLMFHDLNIKDVFIVWDKGVTSEENINDAKRAGFEVICSLRIMHDIKNQVDKIKETQDFIKLKNRVRLKKTVLYCSKQKYRYGKINGQMIICFNEDKARITKEKRIDLICKAKKLVDKGKEPPAGLKKYFRNNEIDEAAVLEAQKYGGYSVLFSTKDIETEKIVKHYFEKDKVEKAFRSLKSVLGLRPIKHWLDERVKSHIFVCYISYLLITLLEHKLKSKNISAIAALDKLSTAYKVHIKNNRLKEEFTKTVTLTKEQDKIMKAVDKKILKRCV